MTTRQDGNTLSYAAIFVAGIGFGTWLLAATPAGALIDSKQLLSGGNAMSEGVTHFASPGFANAFCTDCPGAGLGEKAAQLRMPAGGVLSALRVKLTTATAPSSGAFSVTVRKNGVSTLLTCQVTATGACNATANVTFAANDRLAVQVTNNFVGSGLMGYSYTLLFD